MSVALCGTDHDELDPSEPCQNCQDIADEWEAERKLDARDDDGYEYPKGFDGR